MTVVTAICLGVLGITAVLCVVRELRSTASLPDRLLGLDGLLLVIATGIAVWAARTGDGTYLDAMVVMALISFTATVVVALFVEHRGSR